MNLHGESRLFDVLEVFCLAQAVVVVTDIFLLF